MAHQAAEALVPVVVGVVIDEAIATGDSGALAWSLAALAGLFAVLSTAFRLGFRKAVRAEERAAHELRVELARRVLHPAGGADGDRLPGELLSIATSDAQRVGTVNLAVAMGTGVPAAIVLGGAPAAADLSPWLGLLVLVGLPPVLIVAAERLGRPLAARAAAEQGQAPPAAGPATDLVRGLRVFKGIRAEAAAIDRYRAASREALDATLRSAARRRSTTRRRSSSTARSSRSSPSSRRGRRLGRHLDRRPHRGDRPHAVPDRAARARRLRRRGAGPLARLGGGVAAGSRRRPRSAAGRARRRRRPAATCACRA